ncbi:hypothetical protein ElyMa_005898900 [Elysia marginata]|uniref:Uncharacterized protein n=1 Tax=Elysia marginata TaxID=1093978 RepID=A0AAV4G5X9_9GAST|nr:hypothetical protein ElyMa_005898900 [Elysia marginata]
MLSSLNNTVLVIGCVPSFVELLKRQSKHFIHFILHKTVIITKVLVVIGVVIVVLVVLIIVVVLVVLIIVVVVVVEVVVVVGATLKTPVLSLVNINDNFCPYKKRIAFTHAL